MVRPKGKLVLKYIEDKKSRKDKFATRTKGLAKKIHDFTALCGVEACFIAFGRDGEREHWPEDEEKVWGIIERYTCIEKKKREMNMVDVSSFLEVEKKVLEKQFKEIRRENSEILYPTWDARFNEVSREELTGFRKYLEEKLERVRQRKLELMNQNSIVDGFLDQQVNCGGGFVNHTLELEFDLEWLDMNGNGLYQTPLPPPPMLEGLPELPESLQPIVFQEMPCQFFEGYENPMGLLGSIYNNGDMTNSNFFDNPLPLNSMPMSQDFMQLFQYPWMAMGQ